MTVAAPALADLRLSVILPTPDSAATLQRTIRALAAQSVRRRLELVFVAPAADELHLDSGELTAFGSYQVVEIGPMTSTAVARAAGVRAARAPLVAFGEDHCFPLPGWAEALIDAHRGPWAGVGPVMRNANPDTLTSWANLLVQYGPWLDPAPAGEYDHLPGHNSSYKRDVLLACGDTLHDMLEAESVLHWDLRSRGHRFAIEPAARTAHENFSNLRASLPVQFHSSRLFAASRARNWTVARRAFYACASPLIPGVQLARTIRAVRRIGLPLTPRLVSLLVLLLSVAGIGELAGYASGSGAAMRHETDHEFHRERYVTRHDRET